MNGAVVAGAVLVLVAGAAYLASGYPPARDARAGSAAPSAQAVPPRPPLR